jgi:hypothetical protein
MKKRIQVGIATAALLVAGGAIAQQNVSGRRHPNLAAAQRMISGAMAKLSVAQRANEFDMNGHAAKAKEYLELADREIKEAAVAANHR